MVRYAVVDSLGWTLNAIMYDGGDLILPFDASLVQTDVGSYGDAHGTGNNFNHYVDTAWSNPAGREVMVPTPGERTWVVWTHGQSTISSIAQGTYTPVSSRILNLNPYDGKFYRGTNPVLGAMSSMPYWGNSPNLPIADGLIASGLCDEVILVTLGAINSVRTDYVCDMLRSSGLAPKIILHHYGEAQAAGGSTHDSVVNFARKCAGRFRAKGFNAPYFVALETMQIVNGIPAINEYIRQAQRDCVSAELNIVLGADWDTAVSSAPVNRYDGVHFAEAGNLLAAQADVDMLRAYFGV